MAEDSVALAKAYQAAERRHVEKVTGLRIVDTPPFIIGCPRPGCQFTASAATDGSAVRSISAHLVRAHMQEKG